MEVNMRDLIKIFKALSDETRLRMLKLIQQRELCVCEIMQAMQISQTRASRNLGVLKNAGFITDKREGPWVHYSINKRKVNEYHQEIEKLLEDLLNKEDLIIEDRKTLGRSVRFGKSSCKK
jgi:ArsR family transcriptional regulator, arsenate/arsenite/antimonite-responsive transcriptional repressor